MKQNLLILFALVVLMSSCSSCKDKTVNHPINEGLRASFDYKAGTYWIYKDSLTGDVDSFVVVSNKFYPNSEISNTGQTEDLLYMDVYSYKQSTGVQDSLLYVITLHQSDFRLVSSIRTQDHTVGYDPMFKYPFALGTIPNGNDGDSNGEVVDILSTFTLNNNTYSNVAQVHHYLYGSSFLAHDEQIFVNAEAGIIKWKVNRVNLYNRIWELQRSHIIR